MATQHTHKTYSCDYATPDINERRDSVVQIRSL